MESINPNMFNYNAMGSYTQSSYQTNNYSQNIWGQNNTYQTQQPPMMNPNNIMQMFMQIIMMLLSQLFKGNENTQPQPQPTLPPDPHISVMMYSGPDAFN